MSTYLYTRDVIADRLIEYAEKHPKGFTRDQCQKDLGWDGNTFGLARRHARYHLAVNSGGKALVCIPQGLYEPWLYILTADYEKARPWFRFRIDDSTTRLRGIEASAIAVAAGTDGRSLEGRKARKIKSVTHFLLEQLADMDAAASL